MDLLKRVTEGSPFYRKKFSEAGVDIAEIRTLEDISKLPFTTKEELRDVYPLDFRLFPMRRS